jgi:hypothetical protein
MKRRLAKLGQGSYVDTRLAEQGYSVSDAERIHRDIAGALHDEALNSTACSIRRGAASRDSAALTLNSVFWPEFEFISSAGDDGRPAARRARSWTSPRCCAWHPAADIESGAPARPLR